MVVSKLWHLDDCCTIITPCLNDSGFIHTSVGHVAGKPEVFSRDYIFEKKRSQKVRNLFIYFILQYVCIIILFLHFGKYLVLPATFI